MVEFFVDGRKLVAPLGDNLLEAMLECGVEISYFCYHPGLSVVAVCRQCLVEIVGQPKLAPACQLTVQPGLEVKNNSERVLAARRQMLEFTLLNHPIDCPICDKAGECTLQKHYMGWDRQTARHDHEVVRKPKRVDLGPRIILDDERCILCTRCVRFCQEVIDQPQLTVARRGSKSVLTTAPGSRLDNPYSLNTVDICPVGALTDKDFRFQTRVWELQSTLSVCNGCATGCLCEVHHQRGKIYRLVPRRVRDMNLNWMCDYGRYTYKSVSADRLTLPLLCGEAVGWDDALNELGAKLASFVVEQGQGVGVVLGADVTNEDNFVAASFARKLGEKTQLYLAAQPPSDGDKILRHSDPNANQLGAQVLLKAAGKPPTDLASDLLAGKLRALYLVGDALYLPGAAQQKFAELSLLAVQATHSSPLTKAAHFVLPASMWAEVEGTITSANGLVKRMRAAVAAPDFAKPHWQIIGQLLRKMGMETGFLSARAVFEEMSKRVDFFRRAEWGEEIPTQLLRFVGSRG